MVAHVYCIVFENGLRYIGSTSDLFDRIRSHEKMLRRNKHINKKLQQTYNEFPEFTLEIYPCLNITKARILEEEYISAAKNNNTALNIKKNACGGDKLSNHSNKDEIIKRRSLAIMNNNKKLSAEDRIIKNRFALNGKLNPMYGKTHTKEAREKISIAQKRKIKSNNKRIFSDAQRAALSAFAKTRTGEKNSFYGKHHSEETKKKLSEMHKGRIIESICKKINIDGIMYYSLGDASRKLGIPIPTIRYRINSKNPIFSNYTYH